jgi:hypothetical protein
MKAVRSTLAKIAVQKNLIPLFTQLMELKCATNFWTPIQCCRNSAAFADTLIELVEHCFYKVFKSRAFQPETSFLVRKKIRSHKLEECRLHWIHSAKLPPTK